MKKIILISAIITGFAFQMYAQNVYDVIRYSNSSYTGTARFMGLSGAYGAVGADFSSLSQNPAGIALYRKSEFTITPGFYSGKVNSSYHGTDNSDFKNNLTLGNLGMVFNMNLNENNETGVLKSLQMGFGMNRMNSFNKNILINGFNNSSSLLGSYQNEANNGGNPLTADFLDDFSTLLAYNTNLLVFDSGSFQNPAHWWVDMPNGDVQQSKSVEVSGSSREMLFSGGANFSDKLYLGMSLCFPSIRYEETSLYTETDSKGLSSNNDPSYNFYMAKRSESYTTRGNGFNLKFGFIYKPVEFLRLGGAFHTRTTYNLTDKYDASMDAYFENNSHYNAVSPHGEFDYKITTPMRAIGSVAVLLGKSGLISADYEYIDYTTARIKAEEDDFFDVNDSIHSNLGSAANIRLGAEIKSGVFAFRAGVNSYGSPYKGEKKLGSRKGFSLGFGMREQDYFLDFAYNLQYMEDNLSLYNGPNAVSENKYYSNQFLVTLGLRF